MLKRSLLIALLTATPSLAVQTQYFKHATKADFEAGTLENLVATNFGDLKLSQALQERLADAGAYASIDALAELPDGTLLIGTNASGKLLALKDKTTTELADYGEAAAVSALAVTPAGDVLVGVSGESASVEVLRKGATKPEAFAKIEDAQYVWGIAVAADGKIYCATGPEGQLIELSADGRSSRVVFDSDEDNLRAIAVLNDTLYVGTDPGGLVLRVDRQTGKAFVIYDAAEDEVSALLVDPRSGQIYAATSQLVEAAEPTEEGESPTGRPMSDEATGRLHAEPGDAPEPSEEPGAEEGLNNTVSLPKPPSAAEMDAPAATQSIPESSPSGPKGVQILTAGTTGETAANGNAVYRIDPQGFVSEIFREPVMVLGLALKQDQLLVATGPAGTLYQVDLSDEEHVALAKTRAQHLTSIVTLADGQIVIGTGGVGGAGVSALSANLAETGTYTSPVLDASQISTFGKLQVRGTVPAGTTMTISTRSSNVADEESPLWSDWSEPVAAARFATVATPAARYVQYRVKLGGSGSTTPVLEEVRVAYRQPNVAPRIDSIAVNTTPADGDVAADTDVVASSKRSIEWTSTEPNGDDLKFVLSYRLNGGPWVILAKDLSEATYDWDTRDVPDGRYEIMVEASDALANPAGTGKTASRVSDPVVVDNTPPVIGDVKIERAGGKVTVNLRAADRAGVISSLEYKLDGSEHWQTVPASDMLDDSPDEQYAIVLADPESATRVISLRCRDESGNVAHEAVTVRPEK